MKAWYLGTEGSKTFLEPREAAVPRPGPGELLVKVKAASLNRGEFMAGIGLHKPGAVKPAGQEAAGVVEALGAGVSGFAVGDEVFGRAPGGFAEFAVMHSDETMRKPESMRWEEAASVPLVFLVTYDMLVQNGKLAAHESLLVTGASSGVGVASIQMAKLLGARVIGTSGSADKLGQLKSLGLDVGIVTRAPDFAAQVREATAGKGVDLVVNNVGGTVFSECLRCMAFQGRLATVGYVDGSLKSDIDLEALHSQRLHLFGVSNKNRTPAQRAATVQGFVRDILPAINDRRIRPLIDRVFGYAELPQAKQYMESNAQVGKIVITH